MSETESMEVTKLHKLRKSIKSRLILFAKYVDGVSAEVSQRNSSLTKSLIELQTRLVRAELIFAQFEENQSQIEVLLDDITEAEVRF